MWILCIVILSWEQQVKVLSLSDDGLLHYLSFLRSKGKNIQGLQGKNYGSVNEENLTLPHHCMSY